MVVLNYQTHNSEVLEPNVDQEDAVEPILRVPGVEPRPFSGGSHTETV